MEDEDARRGAAVGSHRRADDNRRRARRRVVPGLCRAGSGADAFRGRNGADGQCAHAQGRRRREAIEAKGANVLYLPPYSPDFNPIEKPFSKIKSILERIAARTAEALEAAVGEALQSFTPQECMNYFASSGYDALDRMVL